jgi:hypothetical protein
MGGAKPPKVAEVIAMEAALWGFLGALVGAGASIATSWLSSRHEIARQHQADSLERSERTRAFQRDNLLALQQSLQDAMRFSARAQFEDEQAFRQGGEWGKALLSEEVSEGSRATNARLVALTERVEDDSVRASVKSLREKLARHSIIVGTREQAEALLRDAMEEFTLVMEQVGTTLRRLY